MADTPRTLALRSTGFTLILAIMVLPQAAIARNSYVTSFESIYGQTGTSDAGCSMCHTPSFGWNVYGQALQALGSNTAITTRLQSIEGQDADGEGHTNLQEITAGAQPGWCDPVNPGCNNGGLTPPAGVSPLDPAVTPNTPPVANAGGPYNATAGVPVMLDGSASSDADGSIASYSWDFGNGTSGQGMHPSATYASAGNYTVTLTVTDNDGATGQDTSQVSVSVNLQPPVADAGGPYSGTAGVPVTFDATGSTDADGSIVSYAWNFGDGGSGTGGAPSHTYTTGGTYQVSVTVTDNDGLTDTAATTASITDGSGMQPPTAVTGGPYTGTTGLPVSFDGSGSSDPDGNISSFEWDFGDGNSGSGANPTHTYASAGTYTVALTVTDGTGLADSASTSAVITDAVNQAPIASPGGPYAGQPGVAVVFDGTASSDPDGSIVTYDWDFGDGTVGTGASPSHIYAAAGDYAVTLRVLDNGGAASAPSGTTAAIRSGDGGDALYGANCAGCHGDPWGSPSADTNLVGQRRVAGARSCTIAAAISGNAVFPGGAPGMGGIGLSMEQVDAISAYLNSREASGEQRYISGCAGCHGNDGRGGRVDENVKGESARGIAEAIREERDMAYLACLPGADLGLIASFLSAQGTGSSGTGQGHHGRDHCKRDNDCDADGRPDNVDNDDDNDGMPDDYEEEMGFDPLNAADAKLDADQDGKSNLAEFKAGTDPLDPASTPGGGSSGGLGSVDSGSLLVLALLMLGVRKRAIQRVPAAADRGS